ncbi:MAG TPA: hypothetical protein VD788_10945 [Candidatus Polarisedimenticolaceae bacterium]|nr:hypothetical protein [Candidatus Polarisedimenticolaceae bacterium]
MKGLRDATLLLGLLLVLTSVKVGPVDGDADLLPVSHAGSVPAAASPLVEQIPTGSVIEPTDGAVAAGSPDGEPSCRVSVRTVERQGTVVVRVRGVGEPVFVRPADRPADGSLWACEKG